MNNASAHPWHVTDVRALPGDSAFLLDNGEITILCDTGYAFTGARVAENVRRVLGDRPLDYIFLTHSHYDHAAGSVHIRRAYPDVTVVAGAYAAGIFAKPTARAVMRDLDRKCAAAHGITDYEDGLEALHADLCVDDGDNIPGTGFTAVALPGHTRCSFGFYDADNRFLLSPETLGVLYGDDTCIPAFLVGYRMTLNAFVKARELDIDAMLLPHRGLVDGIRAAEFLHRSEQATLDTAEYFLGLMEQGLSDDEILARYTDAVYTSAVRDTYPPDAFRLNSSIMIALVRRECAEQSVH